KGRRDLEAAWVERRAALGPSGAMATARTMATARAIVLAEPRLAADVSTADLEALALSSSPGGALAARELARRDDGTLRPLVDRLAEGVDPVVRASVALGLGEAAAP